ncbi:hypothetical protein CRG98_032707, partial [Punica granatum]
PDFGPASHPESFWVSPDLILDSSKEYSRVQEMAPAFFRSSEIPSPMSSWRPYEHQEISPCSSFSNFTGEADVALPGDFSQFGYTNGNFTGLDGSGGSAYDSYDLASSLRNSNLS